MAGTAPINPAWEAVDIVLLDMDGTLLDLNFDTYFWTEYIPLRYGEKYGLGLEEAKRALYPRFRDVEGTINWYCIDYWTEELGLDVARLKREVEHLIAVHPNVLEFLEAVKAAGKRRVLVTNAHMKSIELKMERTPLAGHLEAVVCSHDFRAPKESPVFWEALQQREPFDPARALLVDDSLPVLRTAQAYGIGHLFAVRNPDSQRPPAPAAEFPAIGSFRELMPVRKACPSA